MMRMLKNFGISAALLFVFGLSACSLPPQGDSSSGLSRPSATTARPLRVGALIVRQSPAVDREVAGRSADQYFLPVRQGLDSSRPGFTGANGPVTLTLRSGDQVFWSQQATLDNGYVRAEIPPGTRFPIDAALCVEMSRRIAHQRVRPDFARDGQNVMCTSGASIYRFFNVDRRSGTYFVTAIESAG